LIDRTGSGNGAPDLTGGALVGLESRAPAAASAAKRLAALVARTVRPNALLRPRPDTLRVAVGLNPLCIARIRAAGAWRIPDVR